MNGVFANFSLVIYTNLDLPHPLYGEEYILNKKKYRVFWSLKNEEDKKIYVSKQYDYKENDCGYYYYYNTPNNYTKLTLNNHFIDIQDVNINPLESPINKFFYFEPI